MDYDDIAAHYLVPPTDPIPAPELPISAARRLRDAIEPIATIGWWSRSASDEATAIGLDFFGGYVWGRAAAMGADVSPAVVVSAFGVFDSSLLTAVLTAAKATASSEDVLAHREAGAAAGLAAAASDIDAAVIESLGGRLSEALSDLDGAGRPLFSALRALPSPSDVYGRLWRAAEMVREHRGDGHLAACIAAGLDAVEMNILTELWLDYPLGEYSASRGFSPELIAEAAERLQSRGWMGENGALTADGKGVRESIEEATDRSQQALVDELGDDLEDLVALADTVGAAVLEANAAPADPRKRAAG